MIVIVRIINESPLNINLDGERKFIFRMPDSSIIKGEKHGETNEQKRPTICLSMTEIPSLQIKNAQKMIKYAIGRLKA